MVKIRLYSNPQMSLTTCHGDRSFAESRHVQQTCIAQDMQQENQLTPIDRKDIAQALHKQNFLHLTESIQISPDGRFC